MGDGTDRGMLVDVAGDDLELDRLIVERAQELTDARAWPWMQPGVVSVALDMHGRLTRYLATDTGPVPLGFLDAE